MNTYGVGTGGLGWNGAPPERDDRTLIQAHVDGDPTAFTELVRRHKDRLWAVAMRTLGDREEASDALQDALVSAFRNAGSYRGEAAVTTWLHRVVVNACLDRVRRRQARPSVPLGETEVPSRRDDHAATEARIDVHQALAQLPEPQRAAIVLVDLQDMSVSEAAAVLGVAEGTVKSRCSRGRTELARLLQARLPDPGTRRIPTAPPTGPLRPAPGAPITGPYVIQPGAPVTGPYVVPPAGPYSGPYSGPPTAPPTGSWPDASGNHSAAPRVARPGTRANESPGPATSGGTR